MLIKRRAAVRLYIGTIDLRCSVRYIKYKIILLKTFWTPILPYYTIMLDTGRLFRTAALGQCLAATWRSALPTALCYVAPKQVFMLCFTKFACKFRHWRFLFRCSTIMKHVVRTLLCLRGRWSRKPDRNIETKAYGPPLVPLGDSRIRRHFWT